MIPVSYRERPPLLAFGWVCHAFTSIYMYSRHTITRAYHAYFITMRSDVGHGGYQSFSVRWYLYYFFFTSAMYDSTFCLTYQYIFIRTDVPLPGDTAFLFRACRSR